MQASHQDLAALLEMQQLDIDILHLTKALEELPQRKVIIDARKRKLDLQSKQAQISGIKQHCLKRIQGLEDEERSLRKKEHGIQAAIEAAGNDFRNAEVRTKELDGVYKRLNSIESDLKEEREKLNHVDMLELQASEAYRDVAKTEQSATEEFKTKGTEIKARIAGMERHKASLAENVSEGVKKLYDYTATKHGGIALGKLDGSRCGVCRTPIDSGHLIELKAEAPLGTCPVCHRLLIIEQ
jgi:hypothetical protein